ncbi:High affinity copper uptake protein 1-like 2, partial [Homarus americanus]
MNHSGMDHSGMDHSGMDHLGMDHSGMDHSGMDHSGMDHSGHNMAVAVVNATAKAIVDVIGTGVKMATGSDAGVDHSGHMGQEDHMGHGDHMEPTEITWATKNMQWVLNPGIMVKGMSFHFGYKETILFDWWSIDTIGGLIGSMVGIFILAMLYEGLKYWREHLFRKAIAGMQYCANVQKATGGEENKTVHMNMISPEHGVQTFLHMLQMIVSYFLMLIFMTYNVWLCLATVLGAGVGYFLFGWRKSVVVDITEHCH